MCSSAVDPGIKWEETQSCGVGAAFGLWSKKVTGSVACYTKTTDDLIFTVPVAAGTNLSNFVTTNIGSMKNRGVEATLSARLLNGGPHSLGWSTDLTAAKNTNELVSINPFAGSAQQILVGGIAGGVGSTIQV